ncbi:histidine kinase [Halorubrum sp. SS5]|nr:histidine kinase [Halorubrum sp. SS5]
MGLSEFFTQSEQSNVSLGVVRGDTPEHLEDLLAQIFDRQSVEVKQSVTVPETDSASTDMVYLLDDGDVIAESPLEEVADSILLVNSDLYTTGARSVEDVELPDVITALDETHFRLRGYPESNKEKLLLITISRYIERTALEHGTGKHRASFQQLSRIDDERGTREVYERLGDSDVDVHVYGVPDWTPPPEYELTIHGGWGQEFRDSWFVVFIPDSPSAPHTALLALEDEQNTWDAFWTYDPDTVREINRYIEQEL